MPDKVKRLGGSSDRMKKLGKVRGLQEAASALDKPVSPDSGEMRHMPIDEVRVDPNNPRRLELDWNVVKQDPETIQDPSKRKEVEDIHGMAVTFQNIGQRSPIEVVRDGAIFRIVFGERRYWAARLAGMTTLKVIVLRVVPDNVPLVQLIENIQHKQLTLYKTILNIRAMIDREAELEHPIKDVTDLIDRTGLARASAYRYWKYVDLPNDVEEALENQTINTHDELYALLKHTTAKARKEALARYIAGSSLDVMINKQTPVTTKRQAGGRPRTSISFGSTKNWKVAKLIFEKIDPDGQYHNIDWHDLSAVTKAWRELLVTLEQRIPEDG